MGSVIFLLFSWVTRVKQTACRSLIIYRYNVCMNALEIFAQLSKIASITCSLLFGWCQLIKFTTWNQTCSIILKSGLSVGYDMVRIPFQEKYCCFSSLAWNTILLTYNWAVFIAIYFPGYFRRYFYWKGLYNGIRWLRPRRVHSFWRRWNQYIHTRSIFKTSIYLCFLIEPCFCYISILYEL